MNEMEKITANEALKVIIMALVAFPGLNRPLKACRKARDRTSFFFITSNKIWVITAVRPTRPKRPSTK